MDRAPRARGRAAAHLRRGRPRPRDHRDRRPGRQGRRAGASLREPEGLAAPAPDQPVRHREAHVHGVRGRLARRCGGQARRHPRHAAAGGHPREGEGAPQAQVGRGLAAEDGEQGTVSGAVLRRRRRRSHAPPRPALLAGRPGAVHHPPGRHHEGPADGDAQRRHVPDAGHRPRVDLHALADAQGRPRRSPRGRGRSHPGRGRDRARSRDGVLGERAAAEAPRRAHARRLPPRRAGRARHAARRSTSRCPRTRRSCSRATCRRTTSASRARSATTRATTRTPSRFRSSASARSRCAAMRSTPRSSSASRPPRTRGSARRRRGSSCRPSA